MVTENLSCTLSTHQDQTLFDDCIVRRLTPTECERLQGFPDGWTDIPYRGKEHPSDGVRYAALGNSFAVPVIKWIGERMQTVEGFYDEI